jgi:hypothetical protein
MEVSGPLHAPASVSPKKGPQYPLDRKLVGHFGKERNLSSQGLAGRYNIRVIRM